MADPSILFFDEKILKLLARLNFSQLSKISLVFPNCTSSVFRAPASSRSLAKKSQWAVKDPKEKGLKVLLSRRARPYAETGFAQEACKGAPRIVSNGEQHTHVHISLY